MVPDTRAIRHADERTLERLVASHELMACHRDVLYAVFEASFANAYRAFEFDFDANNDSEEDEFTVELGEHGVRLEGTVRTSGSFFKLEGTLFTTAYVASESYRTALAFMSTFSGRNALRIGQFAPFQTRADARRLFEAARAAMDTCGRLVGGNPIVYPRVDPIVTYALQPEDDRWSLVRCVRIHAGAAVPSIECTLDGIYVFGSGGVYASEMIRGLSRVLEESEGEAAWRARGLIAATLEDAVECSTGVVGDSIAFFVHVYDVDDEDGSTHSVCAALRATRDATGRLVRANILLRGSYDDRPDMHALLSAPELRGAHRTVRWVVPLENNERAAWRWQTQREEGSCTVHAAMLAVKLAQRVIDGDLDVERAMRERCHVAFGAVARYALSVPAPRWPRLFTVQTDGSLWIAPAAKSDVAIFEQELRDLARRSTRTLVVRCRAAGETREAMMRAGFRIEGPFLRKDYH
jgi:hypothetical protein